MRTQPPFRLIFSFLVVASLWPASARVQERNLGLGQTQAGAGGYHALVIGNNVYTSLPRLKTAEADARAVASLLKDAYDFETTLLLNATRQQTISALSAYRRRLGPDANLLIYYAGHGYNDKDADKAYWLPVDAVRDDTSNWIIADEITTALKVIPARHVLVVSDSCYSGTLTRGMGEPLPPAAEREQFLRRMEAGRSRTLMASGGDEPVTDGGGGGRHSVFAAALLRGLREMGREKFTAAELFRHYVEVPVAGRAEQTPEYNPLRNSGHQSGDFVFVKSKTDAKTLEATTGVPATSPSDQSAFELEYWNAIKGSRDPEEYRDYLKRYPQGRFAEIARRRAAGARGDNAVDAASATTTPAPVASGMLRSFEYQTVRVDASGKLKSRSNKTATYYAEDLGGGIALEMVEVNGGTFQMGSPEDETGRSKDEGPQHRVSVPSFWMSRYEVTQAQYQAIMRANPSHFKSDNLPVESVSWHEAAEFCRRLSAKTGRGYRLPSEAEWEYAARAGTRTPFAFGETITTELANYNGSSPYAGALRGTSREKTMPVGSTGAANAFGLYDMHGNVFEWCLDYWHESYGRLLNGAPADGSAWLSGGDSNLRVLRGGSWSNVANLLRSANRVKNAPDYRHPNLGFRVVAVAPR